LLLLNRGFYHFISTLGINIIEQKINFITRLKKGTALEVEQAFTDGYALRDKKERLGSGTKTTRFITLGLIEVRSGKTWHSYLRSVLDQNVLPQKCRCRPIWATLANGRGFLYSKKALGFELFMNRFSQWGEATDLGRLFYADDSRFGRGRC
jgi:hypothetical protein